MHEQEMLGTGIFNNNAVSDVSELLLTVMSVLDKESIGLDRSGDIA
jgi:hypothetical protein